jgi:hypothetical protein
MTTCQGSLLSRSSASPAYPLDQEHASRLPTFVQLIIHRLFGKVREHEHQEASPLLAPAMLYCVIIVEQWLTETTYKVDTSGDGSAGKAHRMGGR